ncbi:MAG: phosphate transport system protein [Oleiphilaceae bacterium]|jgi:phosphate transport system protein
MDATVEAQSLHISRQFNDDLEHIKNHLLEMGGLVESQVSSAIKAIMDGDSQLAINVRETDKRINQMEVDIDKECTRIIARRQPAATDLRFVISVIKVVTDLERIGDESAKIARQAIKLCEAGEAPRGYVEIRHIGDRVRHMTHESLTAFARLDIEAALAVAQEDTNVDREYETAMRELVTYMMEDPASIKRVMNIIWSLRALERIGDHARNIAESVIYIVKGKDVRHISVDELASRVNAGL